MALPRLLFLAASVLLLVLVTALAPYVSSSGLRRAFLDLHAPRALLGAIAGFGLALSGTVLQSVLRNPLACAYTLGVASGSAVGAALVVQTGALALQDAALPWGWLRLSPVAAGALAGAALASALVYTVASRRDLAAETLLLAGAAVALFCGAAISVLHFVADTIDLFAMIRWSMGSLSIVGFERVGLAGALVAAGTLVLLRTVREVDVAALDDDSARGLGVDPVRVRRWAFAGTCLITGGVVAVCGPVGFVGLVVPHAARAFTGPDPRLLLPCAACLGGAFLVACDVAARTLTYPTELPINVITHVIGCPAFVWILVRRA